MTEAGFQPASFAQYEFEVPINAPPNRVWQAIFDETNSWWLDDFRMTGIDSIVSFDPTPGGTGLLESHEDGNGLLWYQVQFCLLQEQHGLSRRIPGA